jgi:hypothetical protein
MRARVASLSGAALTKLDIQMLTDDVWHVVVESELPNLTALRHKLCASTLLPSGLS